MSASQFSDADFELLKPVVEHVLRHIEDATVKTAMATAVVQGLCGKYLDFSNSLSPSLPSARSCSQSG
jgi:hypothetical protein